MRRPALLAVPALAVLALFATRLVPGPLGGGRATLLPSGWRIEPAGRQVSVGTLPLNLVVTGDGLVFVTNNGYGTWYSGWSPPSRFKTTVKTIIVTNGWRIAQLMPSTVCW